MAFTRREFMTMFATGTAAVLEADVLAQNSPGRGYIPTQQKALNRAIGVQTVTDSTARRHRPASSPRNHHIVPPSQSASNSAHANRHLAARRGNGVYIHLASGTKYKAQRAAIRDYCGFAYRPEKIVSHFQHNGAEPWIVQAPETYWLGREGDDYSPALNGDEYDEQPGDILLGLQYLIEGRLVYAGRIFDYASRYAFDTEPAQILRSALNSLEYERAALGTVMLYSDVQGWSVSVDGEPMAVQAPCNILLGPGNHTIEANICFTVHKGAYSRNEQRECGQNMYIRPGEVHRIDLS